MAKLEERQQELLLSEITAAYYDFIDASMQVDIASIKGGKIPIEPQSLSYFYKNHQKTKDFYKIQN